MRKITKLIVAGLLMLGLQVIATPANATVCYGNKCAGACHINLTDDLRRPIECYA